MYFDAHAHLDDEQFAEGLADVLPLVQAAGVEGVVNAACDLDSCRTSHLLAQSVPYIWSTAGIHPHSAEGTGDEHYQEVLRYAGMDKCVAIGEIGLDYHYDFSPRDTQRRVFEAQLALAHELHMPVVLHIREAYADANDILLANRSLLADGVLLHCYSGSAELVRDVYNKLGCYYSFGGAVTFAKHKEEVLSAVPSDRLLLETDCPYMTPVPLRGQRNTPANIPLVCRKVAELLARDEREIAAETTRNAKVFYRL